MAAMMARTVAPVTVAISTTHQPMRQREFLGVGGLHNKANTAIGVQ